MERNPFTPGAGATPPALVGRGEVTRQCQAILNRTRESSPHQGLFLIGLRGVGKTVLLNSWVAQAEQLGFQAITLEAADSQPFLHALAQRTRQTLLHMRPGQALGDKVRRALAILKSFSLTIGVEGPRFGIEVDPLAGHADTGDPELDLQDLFVAIGEAAQERATPVVIAVDELQYVNRAELGALIAAFHHCVQRALPVVVIGGGLPNLPGLAGEAKTYAERLFRFPQIGPLSDAYARNAIAQPAIDRGVVFTDEALDAIITATQGYPYFLQEWAHDAWECARSSPITEADIAKASEAVVRRLDENFFRVRFDRLTDRERLYLRAMSALGPGPHRSGEIADAYGSRVTSLGPLREGLIRKGMLYSSSHGETAFSVPLFDTFMERAIPDLANALQAAKRPHKR